MHQVVADVFACASFKSWLVERIREERDRRTDPTATEHANRFDQHGQLIMGYGGARGGRRLDMRLSEKSERRAERAEFSVRALSLF